MGYATHRHHYMLTGIHCPVCEAPYHLDVHCRPTATARRSHVDLYLQNRERILSAMTRGHSRLERYPHEYCERGLARPSLPVKVLGRGELDRRLTVRAHAVSGSARAKIEAAGGAVEIIEAVH